MSNFYPENTRQDGETGGPTGFVDLRIILFAIIRQMLQAPLVSLGDSLVLLSLRRLLAHCFALAVTGLRAETLLLWKRESTRRIPNCTAVAFRWLFDRRFISFEDSGTVLVSPVVDQQVLESLGVPNPGTNIGEFTAG